MVSLLTETSTPTLYFSYWHTQGVSYFLGSQAFIPTECIWYFLRSTCTGTVTTALSQKSARWSVRGTYSTEALHSQHNRVSWPFYCALAVWGSLLKEPCNFRTAGTGERRIKTYRRMAVTQGWVTETWNMSWSAQFFTLSAARGYLTTKHSTLPLYSLLLCLKSLSHRVLLALAKPMLLMLLRNLKVGWLPKQATLKVAWLCLHSKVQ